MKRNTTVLYVLCFCMVCATGHAQQDSRLIPVFFDANTANLNNSSTSGANQTANTGGDDDSKVIKPSPLAPSAGSIAKYGKVSANPTHYRPRPR